VISLWGGDEMVTELIRLTLEIGILLAIFAWAVTEIEAYFRKDD